VNRADLLLRVKEFRRLVAGMGVPLRDIEDLVQEALETVWANRHQIDPSGNVLAWMKQIARNVVRKYLRRRRSHPEELIPFDEHEGINDDGPDPEATALLHARIKVLRHLISQIPASRRVIFVEHTLLEMPLADIAASHGISPATVSKRLSLAGEDIRAAAARWQAEQRRRGGSTEPAFVLLDAVDLRAWASRWVGAVRRLDARRVAIIGAVVITLGAIPSAILPWYRLSGLLQSGLSSPPRPPRVTEPPPELHDASPASVEDHTPAAPAGDGGGKCQQV
jgi:RNA polymerase sigma factor (sigma-70 family)